MEERDGAKGSLGKSQAQDELEEALQEALATVGLFANSIRAGLSDPPFLLPARPTMATDVV
jgi:hypothetical protein